MTLRGLKYLVTIVNEGSILAASEKLHIAQPSLSQAVAKIENELGTSLFLRNGKHLVPTETCLYIISSGKAILDEWDEFESDVSKHIQNTKSIVTVGMPSGLCRLFKPYLMAELENNHPEIKIVVVEERSDTVEQMIMDGTVDIGIIHSPLVNNKLGTKPLFRTTDLLAVSKCNSFCKTHPYHGLDDLQTIGISEIGDIPFVLMHHHKEDVLVNQIFSESSFHPNVVQTTTMWINVVDYIGNGDFAGLVDEMVVSHDMNDRSIAYYRLDTKCSRTTYAVFHPRRKLSSVEHTIIDCAMEYPRLIRQEMMRKIRK